MKYQPNKIGERIKQERNKAGKTMEELGSDLGTTRQNISKWEKGDLSNLVIDDLLRMCDIFDCEIGYLLCEYDCKTRTATDIKETLGISEDAINNLADLDPAAQDILSYLLCDNLTGNNFYKSLIFRLQDILQKKILIIEREKKAQRTLKEKGVVITANEVKERERKYGRFSYRDIERDLRSDDEQDGIQEMILKLHRMGHTVLDEDVDLNNSIDAMLSDFKGYILYTLDLLSELRDMNLILPDNMYPSDRIKKSALISVYEDLEAYTWLLIDDELWQVYMKERENRLSNKPQEEN